MYDPRYPTIAHFAPSVKKSLITMSDTSSDSTVPPKRLSTFSEMKTSEDYWAIWVGGTLLAIAFFAVFFTLPTDFDQQLATIAKQKEAKQPLDKIKLTSPLKQWLAKPGKWMSSPVDAFYMTQERADKLNAQLAEQAKKSHPKATLGKKKVFKPINILPGLLGVFVVGLIGFGVGVKANGGSFIKFGTAFCAVFLLAVLAYVLAGQVFIKSYNLEYALWALFIGLIISNTIGTPAILKPALKTEFYIKTGLVLLGAGVLFSKLLVLGLPGIGVAWVVTPIVLISTFIFGQKVLKIDSPSLNMVISADMSVCGVSAAIATAAACKAKKEELSLAIGLSLSFTVVMMIVLPAIIKMLGMSQILGGAWMGGTIDATGAVVAAGEFLGPQALEVAAAVKMIQNILIGITAFGVAVYWVTCVEKKEGGEKPSVMEIWYRFPKFIIGFVLASVLFSILYSTMDGGDVIVTSMVKQSTKVMRGWFFCLAFVSIGLETNFRELAKYLKGGKPLILYLCGQTFNLLLTLAMAWLMFEVIFKDSIEKMLKGN